MSLVKGELVVPAIGHALKKKQVAAVVSNQKGSYKIRPMGILARLWHWNDSEYHKERVSKLSSVVAKVISTQKRLSISEAAKDPNLKVARKFLKELRTQKISLPAIENLKKEVTAAKLGIASAIFEHNPGLQRFVEAHHLERYLLGYQDNLQVDPITQEISMRKDGVFQPWKNIYEESKTWTKFTNSPNLTWVYGSEGIQHKDMYEWQELKPFMKGNPADWNHQYVFEFCACFNPNSIKNGNHTWLRLKTPTGDIYSVGLYRPDKNTWIDNLRTPLRIKQGYLMQPDVSEFWDFPISRIDFAISEEIFLKIKQTIETDKKNDDLIFQLFNNNCMLYCKKLALIAGVDLPTLENILFSITPPTFSHRVSKFMEKMPAFIQKICLMTVAFFLNLIQIALGGGMIDSTLNAQQKIRAVPHLTSFKDLFNINKIYLNHPTITFKIRSLVMAWRKKKIEALHQRENDSPQRKEKENKIKLSLPPSYYASSKTLGQ